MRRGTTTDRRQEAVVPAVPPDHTVVDARPVLGHAEPDWRREFAGLDAPLGALLEFVTNRGLRNVNLPLASHDAPDERAIRELKPGSDFDGAKWIDDQLRLPPPGVIEVVLHANDGVERHGARTVGGRLGTQGSGRAQESATVPAATAWRPQEGDSFCPP